MTTPTADKVSLQSSSSVVFSIEKDRLITAPNIDQLKDSLVVEYKKRGESDHPLLTSN
jgi:hypothetical protein